MRPLPPLHGSFGTDSPRTLGLFISERSSVENTNGFEKRLQIFLFLVPNQNCPDFEDNPSRSTKKPQTLHVFLVPDQNGSDSLVLSGFERGIRKQALCSLVPIWSGPVCWGCLRGGLARPVMRATATYNNKKGCALEPPLLESVRHSRRLRLIMTVMFLAKESSVQKFKYNVLSWVCR